MEAFLSRFFNLSSYQSISALGVIGLVLFFLYTLEKKGFSFSFRAFIALGFGLLIGCGLQYLSGFPTQQIQTFKDSSSLHWLYEVHVWLNFFVTIFLNLLRLFIIPIIFIGIISVVISLEQNIKIKSLLSVSIFWLMLTTGIATSIGIALGFFTHLGIDMTSAQTTRELKEIQSLNQIILALIPNNIISAINTNNIIGVVIFAFFIAFGAREISKKQELKEGFQTFRQFIHASYQITLFISLGLIKLVPYAIVLMLANTLITNGFEAIGAALHFIILAYIATFFVLGVHALLLLGHKINPYVYFKKSISVFVMAFTSRSSAATLPITISTLTQKLGVSQGSASCIASLGTTIGMNGCSGYFGGLVGIFIYHALGIPFGLSDAIMIVILCMIASIGIAGIPGISIMVISILLTALGLQSHFTLLAIIFAIDPIIDMARTLANVSGAMTATILTDKKLGLFDEQRYNQEEIQSAQS